MPRGLLWSSERFLRNTRSVRGWSGLDYFLYWVRLSAMFGWHDRLRSNMWKLWGNGVWRGQYWLFILSTMSQRRWTMAALPRHGKQVLRYLPVWFECRSGRITLTTTCPDHGPGTSGKSHRELTKWYSTLEWNDNFPNIGSYRRDCWYTHCGSRCGSNGTNQRGGSYSTQQPRCASHVQGGGGDCHHHLGRTTIAIAF